MSLHFDVFVVDPKPIPSAVPGFEEAVGPATWPPSTSTLISDDGGGLLVDCLITVREGQRLAAWVKSHDCEPGYVYITHPHADHFLGLPEILAAFPHARPVALALERAALTVGRLDVALSAHPVEPAWRFWVRLDTPRRHAKPTASKSICTGWPPTCMACR